MKPDDRTYRLFAEANPAPLAVVATIDRPSADALINDSRRATMLTKEPRLREPAPVVPPRRRGPIIAFATFVVVAAVFGVSFWLGSVGDDGSDVATDPPVVTTTTTTTAPDTTVTPDTTLPPTGVVSVTVPDLVGLSLEEARTVLADLGLEIEAAPPAADQAVIVAQDVLAGADVDEGSTIVVDARIAPTCEPSVPGTAQSSQADITVLFQCGGDGLLPTEYIAHQRLVPLQDGEAIDRIEWTLRALLGGPSEEERIAGFTSFFSFETTDALDSVTLTDGRVIADFNDAIRINNIGTSTGSLFFNAELRANLFQHPEVDSIELLLNGSCEAWSGMFESDGCWVITRADWNEQVAGWSAQRDQ